MLLSKPASFGLHIVVLNIKYTDCLSVVTHRYICGLTNCLSLETYPVLPAHYTGNT